MKKIRITVLKTTLDRDLVKEHGMEHLGACPLTRQEQIFYADYTKPEGFCDEAQKTIYQHMLALAHGAGSDVPYYGGWIRTPGVAICSYNNGLRPVIMKLEATEEMAQR